ncbi:MULTISPECIES: hypothetical protein [Enterobacteriaceae]|uniref:Uncharacterized protein n=3 Tax=Enterobacteriaceae TaxID=543 RepID=A0A7H9NH96_ECOLX|nr:MULTISPECIES: hypothetical protein [Enterobacteriaceae]ELJ5787184.1 hypothetical protein [Klebsiella pneumoniae subsp. pneumoniae HS11286]ELV3644445.1 hypothetical protein [Klebsiella oxytoca]MDI7070843.1 hypothetical protein [Pseudomonas aeruginosa]HBS0596077.1 hypothetical protein [Klebsiella quasipneumoniae subsp. quasipneumoniae]HCI7428466.1 hypothetical protein [Klebsiella pneumoniae subsp. pneumoniae Kp001]HDC4804900.1 hypothetical protein [Enterobacter kobei]
MKSSKFSPFFRSSLPVILLTAFMSPGSFASSIDEPANDKFESSDLPGLNHLTDLINERNTTSAKISEHNVLNQSQEELTNNIFMQLKNKLEQEKIDQLISSLNKNNSSSEELNSSIQRLISILESQKQSHDAVISKNITAEANVLKSTKNDMIELMVEDLGADAQKLKVDIENNDLPRTTPLNESQAMDDLRSQLKAFFLTICVVGLLVFIACKNTTRKK